MQAVETRRRVGFLMIAIAVLMASFVVVAPRVQAGGGDFSLDFVASAPQTYDHATGGGAFDDRTVGVNRTLSSRSKAVISPAVTRSPISCDR